MDTLTDREELAVQTRMSHPPTDDIWRLPIHAVDRALGTTTEESKKIVMDLFTPGHVVPRTKAYDHNDRMSRRGQCGGGSELMPSTTRVLPALPFVEELPELM